MKALPNLDFVRAVAVLSVVVEHTLLAYKVTRIGYLEIQWIGVVGVFIFFVHTSLVLMWSLERKPHTLDFYIRRIFRIYPLAIFVIALTFCLHLPLGGTATHFFYYSPPGGPLDVVSAFLLAPNILHGSYLPVGVMWTLPYEIQMYIALPVIFSFVRKNFSLWPLIVFWLFTVLLCRKLFLGVPHNFFLCIPYFLPGVMAYVGFGRVRPKLSSWLLPIALIACWGIFMIRPSWRIADFLCLAIGFGLPHFHQFKARWLIRVSHEIAKYSYSIYLLHPVSLVLGLYLLPNRPLALQLTVFVTSLAVLSFAGYQLIEKPLIRVGALIAQWAERRFQQYEANLPHRQPEQSKTFESLPSGPA